MALGPGTDRIARQWRRGRPHEAAQLISLLILALLVLGLASLSPAQAQPARPGTTATPAGSQGAPSAREEAPYWIENAELEALAQPTSGESPSRGEVFDSADYQHLLLVSPSWQEALLLTLGTGDVRSYPAASILGEDGRPRRVDPAAGTVIASFATHADGRITFGTTDLDYTIEPAPPLVGEIPLAVLFARQPIYARRSAAYQPDPAMVAKLAGIAEDVDIVAFFGTWCQICKKHLPALISTIDHASNPHLKVTPIAVSEDGAEPADWIEACGAGYATPTFVVRIDGEEVGRIEEEPRGSVEAHLVDILAGATGH